VDRETRVIIGLPQIVIRDSHSLRQFLTCEFPQQFQRIRGRNGLRVPFRVPFGWESAAVSLTRTRNPSEIQFIRLRGSRERSTALSANTQSSPSQLQQ